MSKGYCSALNRALANRLALSLKNLSALHNFLWSRLDLVQMVRLHLHIMGRGSKTAFFGYFVVRRGKRSKKPEKMYLRNIWMASKLIPDDILGRDLIKAGRQYRSGLALLDRFSAAQRYVFTRFLPY